MTTEFRLPDVGEGLDEAEIVEWLVAVGDDIRRDQPLVEILTDKSQTQLPAPVAGRITRLGFAEGDMASVGEILVVIEDGTSASTTPPVDAPNDVIAADLTTVDLTTVEPAAVSPDGRDVSTPSTVSTSRRRPKASPAVRRAALEAGIDLDDIVGTGPGGRILPDDLTSGARTQPSSALSAGIGRSSVSDTRSEAPRAVDTPGQMPAGVHPLRGIRRVTAQAMEQSWQIPHIHGADEFDASNLLAGRAAIRARHGDRAALVTPMAFFVMAVADALRHYPMMNASIDTEAGSITIHEQVNVGFAVATPAGLVVPVIEHADRLDLFGVAARVAELSGAARDRSITSDQMRGGTCTVTNYGSLGGRYSSPIIRAPEVAIVGFGAIRERPFVDTGNVVARPTLPIVTAADHRLVDGDLMTAFQEHIIALLVDPITLVVT